MRQYGQIQCSFWSHPDLSSLSDAARLLACYLLTGPQSNGLGCYRLPTGYVQADLGWSPDVVANAFAELTESGFVERCEATSFVLIPGYLRWNPISNPNIAKCRIAEFEVIPKSSEIYPGLCRSMLAHGNRWPDGFETVLKGFGEQREGEERNQESDVDRGNGEGDASPLRPTPHTNDTPYLTFTLSDGTAYALSERSVDELQATYPNVSVRDELLKLHDWTLNRPNSRKTSDEVNALIDRWLSREAESARKPYRRSTRNDVLTANVAAAQEWLDNG